MGLSRSAGNPDRECDAIQTIQAAIDAGITFLDTADFYSSGHNEMLVGLYQPGRADPDVPYEETIGAIADLIQEGKVRYLGISEVGADLIRRADIAVVLGELPRCDERLVCHPVL